MTKSNRPQPLLYVAFAAYTLAVLALFALVVDEFISFNPLPMSVASTKLLVLLGGRGLALAAPAAIAGMLLGRRSADKRLSVLGALPLIVAVGVTAIAAIAGYLWPLEQAQVTREVLTEPLSISGHTVPIGSTVARKGDVWLVSLPTGGTYDGAELGGTFEVEDATGDVSSDIALERDTTLHGLRCLAGRRFGLYRGLPACMPAAPGVVNGVPCAPDHVATITHGQGDRVGDFGVRCTLAAAYTTHGIRWPPASSIDTTPGYERYVAASSLPSLLLYGHPLPPRTEFAFIAKPGKSTERTLIVSTPQSTIDYGGCTVSHLTIFNHNEGTTPDGIHLSRHSDVTPAGSGGTCTENGPMVGMSALTRDGKILDW